MKQGLSPQDVSWFRGKVEKKYPAVCYVDPSPTVPLVFVVIVTPDTYHGTRVITNTETHENPISGTVTDQDGNTADISATQQTTTSSTTAVPYSFQYGIFTLTVETPQKDGTFLALHRFQRKGIYNTLYGIPLGGKGHHPFHAVIEEAAEWISKGGLAEAQKMYAAPSASTADQGGSKVLGPPQSQPVSKAVLDISSTPTGAEIAIDGVFIGNAPSSIEVTPGEHSIRISKKGFVPWERNLKAMPGHSTISPELQPQG